MTLVKPPQTGGFEEERHHDSPRTVCARGRPRCGDGPAVDGYTIEFTLVDYGEPGSSDRAALRIFKTANPAEVVLNVPLQLLTTGNLQAHYDQPHKT